MFIVGSGFVIQIILELPNSSVFIKCNKLEVTLSSDLVAIASVSIDLDEYIELEW